MIREALKTENIICSILIKESAEMFLKFYFSDSFQDLLNQMIPLDKGIYSYKYILIDSDNKGCLLNYTLKNFNDEIFYTIKQIIKIKGLFPSIKYLLRSLKLTNLKLSTNELYLSNISVFAEYRRNGIATMLIEKAEENAKAMKYKKMVLDVEPENKEAIRLYLKLGFKIIYKYAIGKFPFYRMEKEL